MQDIFISILPTHISAWSSAFPDSTVVAGIADVVLDKQDAANHGEAPIFWLHMNEDRQQWLVNTIATISTRYKKAKIVVLANAPNHAESLHVLSLGVMGYAHAYSSPEVLQEIKTVISHGGIWLGQELLLKLIASSTKLTGNSPAAVDTLLAKLTKREREVAIEAAKGLSNKEIARILAITERTVKAHLAAIFVRLGAKDRLQLALMLNNHQSFS